MTMKRIVLTGFVLLAGIIQAQVKPPQAKPKAEKKWVNPVKLTKEERNRPYMDEVLKTRDTITPEEAERRRRNIAIGNPFKDRGYYPKIATLSKGKYLEFHDMDAVVNIGSVKYNRKTKEITEFREIDLSDPDAQPYLDTAGRWFSPDPLSEEYSSWSPYNMVLNNPISNIDPDGRQVFTDYKLLQNGEIQRVNPLDGSEKRKDDRLFTTNGSGKVTAKSDVFTIDKDKASDVSIIGQLSQTNDIKLPDYNGMALNPFFSEGFTSNLDTAFNLYNFLDNNTSPGIEFSLGNYSVNGKDNFQIASMHDWDASKITSNRFSQDNLVWSVHNHDGGTGLKYKTISNQFDTDFNTAKKIMWENYKKNIGYPSFYIVNDNLRMIEVTRSGPNTSTTYPFSSQFLKTIKRK